MILPFILGFFAKIVSGLDDAVTNVPLIASVAGTRGRKLFFSIGYFLAIGLAIAIAYFFSQFLVNIPYYRIILAMILFGLAGAIYLDLFVHEPKRKTEKLLKIKPKKALQVLGIGFITSFATVIDDIAVFTPLFLENHMAKIAAVAGIILAAIIELHIVIHFSEKLERFKYKEELASIGLVIMALLLVFKII